MYLRKFHNKNKKQETCNLKFNIDFLLSLWVWSLQCPPVLPNLLLQHYLLHKYSPTVGRQ